MNVNQEHFTSSSATSLSLVTRKGYDLADELPELLSRIESRYLQLREGKYDLLMNEYLGALFRRHEKHLFSSDGKVFEGVIQDLDEWGKLRVGTAHGVRSFGIKEIRYMP